jgi:Transmembrane exosortase (Exosortase_EpsH).
VTTPAAAKGKAPSPQWETIRQAVHSALAALPEFARKFWSEERHWLLVLTPLFLLLYGPFQWFLRIWAVPHSPLAFQPLVPLGALALAWADRKAIQETYRAMADIYLPTNKRRRGTMLLAALGCVLMVMAYLMMLAPLAMIGFIVTVAGILLHLYGGTVFLTMLRPLLFLFTIVPLPSAGVDLLQKSFQAGSAAAATQVIKLIHPSTRVIGNRIILDNYSTTASGASSGLNTLLPTLVLALWLGLFRKMKVGVLAVLLTAAGAISLLLNSLRLALVGLIGVYNTAWAERLHDLSPWVITGLAFYLTYLLAERIGPRKSRLDEEDFATP